MIMLTSHRNSSQSQIPRKILVLHGDRQTGELFLGRIAALRKKLNKLGIDVEAPDGTFPWRPIVGVHTKLDDSFNDQSVNITDALMRTWWIRSGDYYQGLEETISRLQEIWNQGNFEGILGFSQGARLAYLLSVIHQASDGTHFHGLRYLIVASGYGDVPLPTNLWNDHPRRDVQPILIPSLHIMGREDKLIPLHSSITLANLYHNALIHEHGGGHHVPMKSTDVVVMLNFIQLQNDTNQPLIYGYDQASSDNEQEPIQMFKEVNTLIQYPDDEHLMTQIDEITSLSLIFPDEFKLLSNVYESNGEKKYDHPIIYSIQLRPAQMDQTTANLWPPKEISLQIEYTPRYPDELPRFTMKHEMNLLELRLSVIDDCINIARSKAITELGTPCVMSCFYAVKDFFEYGGLHDENIINNSTKSEKSSTKSKEHDPHIDDLLIASQLPAVSDDIMKKCILQGIEIANEIIGRRQNRQQESHINHTDIIDQNSETSIPLSYGKGGYWQYTIGLIGKPSAGKSTFFNTATGFARQRGTHDSDGDSMIGGAAMAPHPFTTINPNMGYCLVPAPKGSCPEDDEDALAASGLSVGSTHGRSSNGQRFLPIMLKDVAGLVPGAYQGRGKGNKFLDDLTDADVLIHVMDASGMSDSEGNIIGFMDEGASGTLGKTEESSPLHDLFWIHNELIQWVASNIEAKWDTIVRRGKAKLVAMFSGYKQNQAFVWDVVSAVEKFVHIIEGIDDSFDHLNKWNKGDLLRLVAAFLGARFPMALALNKCDISTAMSNVKQIQKVLPAQGAHAAIPMSCLREMLFVRHHIMQKSYPESSFYGNQEKISRPDGVWLCLETALCMRKPVLVFPVCDMTSYFPLSGFNDNATNDPSLPSMGMIHCIIAAGGSAPSQWDTTRQMYILQNSDRSACRDVLVMKPGSTVDDVFTALKWMGALSGEYIRAEAASSFGEKAKLVKKTDLMGVHNRILKIMTTKRREWQRK